MAAALESLNGFSFVCVCWCLSVSLWVRERAHTRWMIGNTTEEIERDQVMVIESWVATLHSLSRALRARVRRATLPSWVRCPFVCLNTNDRERLMLIVLCYWCLQLLHVDLIIIKRTLLFQHNNNKRIVKLQHHQLHTSSYSLPQQ